MRVTPIGSDAAYSWRTSAIPQSSSASSTARPVLHSQIASHRKAQQVDEEAAAHRPPFQRGEHVVLDGEAAEDLLALEGSAHSVPGAPDGDRVRDVLTLEHDLAAVGARWPETTSNSVVLPAPFGPTTPSSFTAVQIEVEIGQRGHAAVADAELPLRPAARSAACRRLPRLVTRRSAGQYLGGDLARAGRSSLPGAPG